MAEEAGCIDFYNYVYTPFSACAHSMWHHIARYDLGECGNPLHRHHRRPTSEASSPDTHYLTLAAKYWSKTLGIFDRTHELMLRSEEHTSELQSLMRISYAVLCLKKK